MKNTIWMQNILYRSCFMGATVSALFISVQNPSSAFGTPTVAKKDTPKPARKSQKADKVPLPILMPLDLTGCFDADITKRPNQPTTLHVLGKAPKDVPTIFLIDKNGSTVQTTVEHGWYEFSVPVESVESTFANTKIVWTAANGSTTTMPLNPIPSCRMRIETHEMSSVGNSTCATKQIVPLPQAVEGATKTILRSLSRPQELHTEVPQLVPNEDGTGTIPPGETSTTPGIPTQRRQPSQSKATPGVPTQGPPQAIERDAKATSRVLSRAQELHTEVPQLVPRTGTVPSADASPAPPIAGIPTVVKIYPRAGSVSAITQAEPSLVKLRSLTQASLPTEIALTELALARPPVIQQLLKQDCNLRTLLRRNN